MTKQYAKPLPDWKERHNVTGPNGSPLYYHGLPYAQCVEIAKQLNGAIVRPCTIPKDSPYHEERD